jgi:glycosyltransferase involved in cell wall biosynthesis
VHLGFALLTLVPGRMGGSETYVRSLLREFAAGNGPERVTALLNPRAAEAYAGEAGGAVSVEAVRTFRPGRRTPARAAALLGGYAASPLVARGLPPGLDVMHFPVTVPIPRTRLPHVVTLMDVQHHDLPHNFSRAERELRRFTYDRAARRADAVVTLSEYSRGRIVEVLGIPPERVEPVHLGIDHERFSPERGDDDERLLAPLGLERPFVLYPANLWPHKNHERLVDAFARVDDADLELLLTGRTYGRLEALLARARAAGARVRRRRSNRSRSSRLPIALGASFRMTSCVRSCAMRASSAHEAFRGGTRPSATRQYMSASAQLSTLPCAKGELTRP